jgi:hypothetical protein
MKTFVDLQMVLATATTPPSKGQGLDKLNTKHLIMLRV